MQGEEGVSMKEEKLPPGFRFHPTDEELITYYLINKISDANFTARAVTDVDLNKSEPWDLPGMYIALISSSPSSIDRFFPSLKIYPPLGLNVSLSRFSLSHEHTYIIYTIELIKV